MSVIAMFAHVKSIELRETGFVLIDFSCNGNRREVSRIAKHRYHCTRWLIFWKIGNILFYIPPIECPTQWNLFASKPSWNNLVSALPACFEMIDARTMAEWRRLTEYWPQSRIKMLWSLRLMYALVTVWTASLLKSSIHPETREQHCRRHRLISVQIVYELYLTRFIKHACCV